MGASTWLARGCCGLEAGIADIIIDDSIEAALVMREAKAVGAGGVKARRPGLDDGFDPLVRFPMDALRGCGPGDAFQRGDHFLHADGDAGETKRSDAAKLFRWHLEAM